MKTITYSEHNFKALIKEYKPISKKLIGMREGKPFLREGKVMINVDDNLCEVEHIEYFDKDGNSLESNEVKLDTDERISGIILQGQKVLLLHRVKKDKEYYVFPGGHRIKGESDIETLIREMKEELNLDVNSEVELILELNKENFGKEKFYLIKDNPDLKKIFKNNPDQKEGEVNEIVFIDIEKTRKMDNVFPKEVIKKIN